MLNQKNYNNQENQVFWLQEQIVKLKYQIKSLKLSIVIRDQMVSDLMEEHIALFNKDTD